MGTPWTHRMTEVDEAAGTGTCAHCGPVALRWRSTEQGRRPRCANGVKAQRRAAPSYAGWHRYEREHHHGLTADEARRRLMGKECEVCGHPATANDHDHDRDVLRGVLCHLCNSGLGLFRDDPALLDAAAQYLRRYAAEVPTV